MHRLARSSWQKSEEESIQNGGEKRNRLLGKHTRSLLRVYGHVTWKAKDHLDLNLARNIEDYKKDFFKHISSKRKTRENVGLLLKGIGTLVMKDTEKVVTECLSLLPSALLIPALRNPRPQRQERKAGEKKTSPCLRRIWLEIT